MEENIIISVVMITYNHEKYIKQAIEGILMQECDFEVELIIADDCSPDRTEEAVKETIKNHPNKHWVKYTKHSKNKGMNANFIWATEQVKGKYIALCEGDDYWTDPLKLQKQVDFLEGNDEYTMCFHNALFKYMVSNYKINQIFIKNKDYTANELLLNWVVPTASIVFNKNLINFDYLKSNHIVNGDIFIVLMCAEKGNVRGFKDSMSTYRIHNKGISIDRIKKDRIKLYLSYINHYKHMKKIFNRLSKHTIHLKIFHNYMNIYISLKNKNKLIRYKYLTLAIYYNPSFFLTKLIKR